MRSSKSLEELEGEVWAAPTFESNVAKKSYRLRKVPLSELTAEDLRFLIGQLISLEYTVPLAIDLLERNILASGDMYIGDLLRIVAEIGDGFWRENVELNNRLVEIKIEAEVAHETLREILVSLGRREFQ